MELELELDELEELDKSFDGLVTLCEFPTSEGRALVPWTLDDLHECHRWNQQSPPPVLEGDTRMVSFPLRVSYIPLN